MVCFALYNSYLEKNSIEKRLDAIKQNMTMIFFILNFVLPLEQCALLQQFATAEVFCHLAVTF